MQWGPRNPLWKKYEKMCGLCTCTKGDQAGLYEDVKLHFSDPEVESEKKDYLCTREKAHGQLERREYYQCMTSNGCLRRKNGKG